MIDFNIVNGIGSATESNPLLIDKLVLVIEGTTKIITKFIGAVVSDDSELGNYLVINFNDTSDEAYTISKIRLMDINGGIVAESPELSLVKEQGNSLRVRLSARFPGAAACTFYNISINIPYATKNRDGLIRLAKEDEDNKSITVYSAEDTDALIQDNLVDTSQFVSWDSGVLTASQLNLVENYNSPINPVRLNKSSNNGNSFLNITDGYIGGNAVTDNPSFDQNTNIVATPQVVTANYISQLYSNSVLDGNDEATDKLVSGAAVESYVTDRLASIDTSADMQEALNTLYVHKTGNTPETITGEKTFTDSVTISGNNKQLTTPSVSSGEYTGDGVYNTYNSETWISSSNLSKIPTINAIRSAISSISSSVSGNTQQLEETLSDLSDDVNALKAAYNFADVVATKTALNQLSTTNLLNNDKVLVLVDGDAGDISTVYRLVKGTGGNSDTWNYLNSIKTDSYTKSTADSTFIKTANLAQSISSSTNPNADVPSVGAITDYVADRESNYYNKSAVDGLIANVQSSNVNDATLTIKKNSSDVGDTFTANASQNKTIDLDLATVASTGDYGDLINRPKIPIVPTNISAFTNDAQYVTQNDIAGLTPGTSNYSFADDPNVPNWVKSSTKPTYTASEVGALPDNTTIPAQANNAKLTIKKNTNDAGTEFTADASTDVVCNLGLSTVATSGDYNDLSGAPTFKTINGEQITGSGNISVVASGSNVGQENVIEAISVNNINQAPVNKSVNITVPTTVAELTDASNYVQTSRTINSKALSSNVTLTLDDIADGTNRSIPTVNNSTITIKKNTNDTGDTFTTNNATTKTINLGLSTVATSGSYNDLSDKPTIPTVNNATLTISKGGTDNTGSTTFSANASSNVTINLGLHTVATSGSYNDLTNKPTIPTIPTNHVTTDTTQSISGAKTFSNSVTFDGTDSDIAVSDGAMSFTGTDITSGITYTYTSTIQQDGLRLNIQPSATPSSWTFNTPPMPVVSIGNSSSTSADFSTSLLTLNGDSSNKYVVKPSNPAGADLGALSNKFDSLYVKNIKATGTVLPVAYCSTDAGTYAKNATIYIGKDSQDNPIYASDYEYVDNSLILVHFANTNTSDSPKLYIYGDLHSNGQPYYRPIYFGADINTINAELALQNTVSLDPDNPDYENYLNTPGKSSFDSWHAGETVLMLCRYGRYYIVGKQYGAMSMGVDTTGANIANTRPSYLVPIDARRLNNVSSINTSLLANNNVPVGIGFYSRFYSANDQGPAQVADPTNQSIANATQGYLFGCGLGGVIANAIRGISSVDWMRKIDYNSTDSKYDPQTEVSNTINSSSGVGQVSLVLLKREPNTNSTDQNITYAQRPPYGFGNIIGYNRDTTKYTTSGSVLDCDSVYRLSTKDIQYNQSGTVGNNTVEINNLNYTFDQNSPLSGVWACLTPIPSIPDNDSDTYYYLILAVKVQSQVFSS